MNINNPSFLAGIGIGTLVTAAVTTYLHTRNDKSTESGAAAKQSSSSSAKSSPETKEEAAEKKKKVFQPVVNGVLDIPMAVMTDSYKAAHYLMYPEATEMVAYGEFRTSFNKQKDDSRFIFFGMRHIIETYLSHQWTLDDVERAEHFYNTHNAAFTPYPFPKHLFLKFIAENDGYFPVKIEALPEGTVAPIHTPVYQISAYQEYSHLCTFMETLLTQVWYPTCVATLSRLTKDHIEDAFHKSVDDDSFWLLDSRLHDFGFRGATCVEQSVIGGAAHLLNFTGSDTMSACYYVQYKWNNGEPIATSIPATEHSVMTSWPTEREAMEAMIKQFGDSVFATVMDSYDYERALNEIVPQVAPLQQVKKGLWVMRPDSGDPTDAVLQGLRAAEAAFGSVVNGKGYKVIKNAAVIQGDGINKDNVKQILQAVLAEGYSAQNVAFGMGGGLLQKVNRDTMSFATKLSFIRYADGREQEIMKFPKSDAGKISFPGILRVKRLEPTPDSEVGLLSVLPRAAHEEGKYEHNDLLRLVYDHRPLPGVWDDFKTVRARAQHQWRNTPKNYDPISKELKQRIVAWTTAFNQHAK